MHDPKPCSFVAAEVCDSGTAQKFTMTELGKIKSVEGPDLCLTLGKTSVPGGGHLASIGARPRTNNAGIPQIRRLTFETCNESNDSWQRWTFRRAENQHAKTTE